jgi:ABC-type antimicrobial peptide transport system permease subunit
VGRPPATARDEIDVQLREVSAGYFGVMGVPVLEGRAFADDDVERRAPVVLVNRTFRDRVFPGGRALGERVSFAFTGDTQYEIVGVVADERVTTLDAAPPPALYWPTSGGGTAFVVRTAVPPESLRAAVEDAVRSVSRDLAVAQVASMDEVIAASPQTFLRRYPALLLASFGVAALVLALVGIYGVLSQHTARRTREIGVRMALGARPFDVLRLVLGRVALLTLAGITLGTVTSLYTGRALSALLFQVQPGDPWATAVGAVSMFTLALVAGYGPARRAMSVDPTTALRSE